MNPTSPQLTKEPRTVGILALIFSILALVPLLGLFVMSLAADGLHLTTDQQYELLLPGLVFWGGVFTLTPGFGLTSLILSIIAISKSRATARVHGFISLAILGLVIILAAWLYLNAR